MAPIDRGNPLLFEYLLLVTVLSYCSSVSARFVSSRSKHANTDVFLNILFIERNGIQHTRLYLRNKIKSFALLPSNLPSVIDRSHLSPSREATKSEDLSVVVLSFLSYFFFIILFLSHFLRSAISLPFLIGSFSYLAS